MGKCAPPTRLATAIPLEFGTTKGLVSSGRPTFGRPACSGYPFSIPRSGRSAFLSCPAPAIKELKASGQGVGSIGAFPPFGGGCTTRLLSSMGKKMLWHASGAMGTNSDWPSMLFTTSRMGRAAGTRLEGVTGDAELSRAEPDGARAPLPCTPCRGTSSGGRSIPCSRSKPWTSCMRPPNF